ncbi:hypothetical protein C8N26_0816 [Tenacibaculum lutimaris]|uniref:DUF2975 family protein n=1 Tax=Tenacibaculum lutimaris TaxID=285258 RepID=A0A420E203_9FLAO|nr:DUF2975 domain-containing protein [Tenacibaculum lutimaris]RKF04155.1 hypothetical protein C8N26_0816 [Tenacibaculum lutimaris]
MRKLKILKSLIDFIFIVYSLMVPFLIIGIPTAFFMTEQSSFKILGLDFNVGTSIISKVFVAIFLLVYVLVYNAIYKFRIVLTEFVRTKVFSEKVIMNLKGIGNLLLISGILMIVARVGLKLTTTSVINFDFGVGAHYLTICFGLFFLVLSEIFRTSKELKQENDLTI